MHHPPHILALAFVSALHFTSTVEAGSPVSSSIANDVSMNGGAQRSSQLPTASISNKVGSTISTATATTSLQQSASDGSIYTFNSVNDAASSSAGIFTSTTGSVTFGSSDHGHVYVKWNTQLSSSANAFPGTVGVAITAGSPQQTYYTSTAGQFEGDVAGKTLSINTGGLSFQSPQSAQASANLYWSFNGWPGDSASAPINVASALKTSPTSNRQSTIFDEPTAGAGLLGNDWPAQGYTPVYTSAPPPINSLIIDPHVIVKYSADNPIASVTPPTNAQTIVFKACGLSTNPGALCLPGAGASLAQGADLVDADGFIHMPVVPNQPFNFLDYATNGIDRFLFTGVNIGSPSQPNNIPAALSFTNTAVTQIVVSEYTTPLDPYASVGDYNHDGATDMADYVQWRNAAAQNSESLQADGDASGKVDSGDDDIWRQHFGQTHASGSTASVRADVPEPTYSQLILVCGILASCCAIRFRLW